VISHWRIVIIIFNRYKYFLRIIIMKESKDYNHKVYTIDASGIGSTFPDHVQSVQKVVGPLQGPSRALGGGAGG
jgi:hypothetical protein